MTNIEDFDNYELLTHFKDAVCDRHYNPSGDDYNESGFSYDELETELLKRMSKNENDEKRNT